MLLLFRVKDLNLNYLSQSQASCQLDELGLAPASGLYVYRH